MEGTYVDFHIFNDARLRIRQRRAGLSESKTFREVCSGTGDSPERDRRREPNTPVNVADLVIPPQSREPCIRRQATLWIVIDLYITPFYLVETVKNFGIEGAEEFLLDPKNGVTKVKEELAIHKISLEYRITFLQVLCLYFVLFGQINGKVKLGGAQPPETFKSAFEAVSA
ncbi:unnamed protein product [Brassica oleracea]|uniref:Uncharacterized protein n=1 Tax=Brassica oleracea TaxID=3712 RepID=A0A3P6A667_BRAOL|nr:unnamed protein product [Brassica oleracea]